MYVREFPTQQDKDMVEAYASTQKQRPTYDVG